MISDEDVKGMVKELGAQVLERKKVAQDAIYSSMFSINKRFKIERIAVYYGSKKSDWGAVMGIPTVIKERGGVKARDIPDIIDLDEEEEEEGEGPDKDFIKGRLI